MPATTGVYLELVEGLPHTWRVQYHRPCGAPLTLQVGLFRLATMEVHLRPETESRLQELATESGRASNDLIEDAMAAYLQEAQVREMLDCRYDDLKSCRVKPVDGENR